MRAADSPAHAGLYALFALVLLCHVLLWTQTHGARSRWLNVPPVPEQGGAEAGALGDAQFAYRVTGIMLQNLGDTGGRSTRLADYDYKRLAQWFALADALDPRSNYVPLLAAYYFGAVEDPQKLAPLVEYLTTVGRRGKNQKWRWLAQAVYLARYKMKDTDKAYALALELAAMDDPSMPMWTRQMPAFIKNDEGDRKAAYDIMVEILRSGAGKIDPVEVNFMKDYICTRILNREEAQKNPLCEQTSP